MTWLLRSVALVALAGLLGGCSGGAVGSAPPAPEVQASAARPAVLDETAADLRAERLAAAQARIQRWVEAPENAKSPYRAEAYYLHGQALYGRKEYIYAKESFESAADATQDHNLEGAALFGRANCNYELKEYRLVSRQYHWLTLMYRDVEAVKLDEVFYKLGMSCKQCGFPQTADHWFSQVIELYATGPYAEDARRQHSRLAQGDDGQPVWYTLELEAVRDQKAAEAEAAILRSKGYQNVTVVPTSILGNKYYSIQAGRYFNRTEALTAKEDAQLVGLSPSVRPSIIPIPK